MIHHVHGYPHFGDYIPSHIMEGIIQGVYTRGCVFGGPSQNTAYDTLPLTLWFLFSLVPLPPAPSSVTHYTHAHAQIPSLLFTGTCKLAATIRPLLMAPHALLSCTEIPLDLKGLTY